jgi:SAM-dependent methyltransferase
MDNMQKQRKFLEYFDKKGPVLELGSGAGDFLSLCAQAGIEAIGVDSEPGSCKDTKVKIVKADIIKYLRKQKKNIYAGIYARHIVEHFYPAELRGILKDAYKTLKKNGRLVAVFPNMKNISVATYEFWNDETHARPYTGESVKKLLVKAGFSVIVSGADRDSWDDSLIKNFFRFIRKILTGMPVEPPDYYVVAEKR